MVISHCLWERLFRPAMPVGRALNFNLFHSRRELDKFSHPFRVLLLAGDQTGEALFYVLNLFWHSKDCLNEASDHIHFLLILKNSSKNSGRQVRHQYNNLPSSNLGNYPFASLTASLAWILFHIFSDSSGDNGLNVFSPNHCSISLFSTRFSVNLRQVQNRHFPGRFSEGMCPQHFHRRGGIWSHLWSSRRCRQ